MPKITIVLSSLTLLALALVSAAPALPPESTSPGTPEAAHCAAAGPPMEPIEGTERLPLDGPTIKTNEGCLDPDFTLDCSRWSSEGCQLRWDSCSACCVIEHEEPGYLCSRVCA